MQQFYIIDALGFFISPVVLTKSEDYDPTKHIEQIPPSGLFKPKWDGDKWIEGKTEEESLEDAFLESLNPSTQELVKAERELETIELLIEMGLI